MINNRIHLINTGCHRPGITYTAQRCGLKYTHIYIWHVLGTEYYLNKGAIGHSFEHINKLIAGCIPGQEVDPVPETLHNKFISLAQVVPGTAKHYSAESWILSTIHSWITV